MNPDAVQEQTDPFAQVFSENNFKNMLLNDMNSTGGKNVNTLITVAGILNPALDASNKPSALQQKTGQQLSFAQARLNQLGKLFETSGAGRGRIPGFLANIAGAAGFNNPVSVYNRNRASAGSILARALGEVGTLTDRDIQRVVSTLPRTIDNPEEAQASLNQIQTLLEQMKQINQTAPSTNSNFDLSTLLQG